MKIDHVKGELTKKLQSSEEPGVKETIRECILFLSQSPISLATPFAFYTRDDEESTTVSWSFSANLIMDIKWKWIKSEIETEVFFYKDEKCIEAIFENKTCYFILSFISLVQGRYIKEKKVVEKKIR